MQLLLEAIPKAEADQGRRYRGFIAIDDIQFRAGDECSGHCTFDSGLCKFSNDPNGNFEWQVVSGSGDLGTQLTTNPSIYRVFAGNLQKRN